MTAPLQTQEDGLPVRIPHEARLEIGHALGEWLAHREGIRILHIKGLAAEAVLPAGHGMSADVDLLVDPTHYERFVSALAALETTEVVDDAGRSSEAHAIELVSHGLSVSLDVHGHYPGFRAPTQEVFEVLFDRRVMVELGGWGCSCLDRIGLAVLGVVHAARNVEGSRSHRMALHRWDLLGVDERREAMELIATLGAGGAAATVIGPHGKASRRDVALFLAHQRRASPVALWMLTIASARGLRPRLAIARRALSARSPVTRTLDPPGAIAGRERQGRLRRGMRGLVPAVREVVTLLKVTRHDR